jgi:hypothetical protein
VPPVVLNRLAEYSSVDVSTRPSDLTSAFGANTISAVCAPPLTFTPFVPP